jgi:hypothetical protein
MSQDKPFIVRSDTPHSVEVVAGSLNAKGKKNWVKAGQDDPNHQGSEEKEMDLGAHLESLLFTQDAETEKGSLNSFAASSEDAQISSDSLAEHVEKLEHEKGGNSHQQIDDANQAKDRFLGVGEPGLKNNTQKIEAQKSSQHTAHLDQTPGSQDHQIKIPQDKVDENLAKIVSDRLEENLQKVGLDTGMDNKVKLDVTSAQDNNQKIPTTKDAKHQISLDMEVLKDNTQTVAANAAKDNLARLDGTVYELNQTQKAYSEISDRHSESVPTESQVDNKVKIGLDSPSSNAVEIDAQGIRDRQVAIDTESIEDNNARIQADSIRDRRAKFEEIRRSRNAPRVEVPNEDVSPEELGGLSQGKTLKPVQAKELSREEKVAMARKKKSDEFHGRVEAIKNTVVQLNTQLDKLEDTSVELKKISF